MAFLIGLLYRGLNHSAGIGPFAPGSFRLEKAWYEVLRDGFGCGVLVYLSVELYRKTKSLFIIVMCIMAFILSGTEHSIADAFFLGASQLTGRGFGYLGLVILGNAFGAVAVHWLQVGAERLNELPNDGPNDEIHR